jgi:hypothetical protein
MIGRGERYIYMFFHQNQPMILYVTLVKEICYLQQSINQEFLSQVRKPEFSTKNFN